MSLLFFIFKRLFSRGNRQHFSMLLFSYRNTFQTPERLKIAYRNTRTSCTCSHAIFRFSRTPLVFLQLHRNTKGVFHFINEISRRYVYYACPSWYLSFKLKIVYNALYACIYYISFKNSCIHEQNAKEI